MEIELCTLVEISFRGFEYRIGMQEYGEAPQKMRKTVSHFPQIVDYTNFNCQESWRNCQTFTHSLIFYKDIEAKQAIPFQHSLILATFL